MTTVLDGGIRPEFGGGSPKGVLVSSVSAENRWSPATGPWGSVACVSSGAPLPQVGRGWAPGLGSLLCWVHAFSP